MDIELLKNLVDYGVIAVLVLMSFISIMFFIERFICFKTLDISTFNSQKELELTVSKHLTTIGTIASNAPYIGLLGTVLAIMLTFITMSHGDIIATKIMSSLALALKATAVGLVVAIISMIFYNILTRYAEVLVHEYEIQKI